MLLHADADAFFASVEERDDATLRGTAFVVGDPVVACASYPARALGIHAGMPVGRVRARWSDVRVVGLRDGVHEQASAALFGLFRELIGVGRTKLMAKLASRRAKPDGLHVIAPADEAGVRDALRLEEIWGVGPRTQARLREAGLRDLTAVRAVSRDGLEDILGRTMGRLLHDIAHGRESSTVVLPGPAPTPATITGELAPMLAATAYEEDGRGVAVVGVTAHLPPRRRLNTPRRACRKLRCRFVD